MGYTQQPKEIAFHQVACLPVGARAGELALRITPDRMVFAPKLLPPDRDGFWVIGEAKGGIMRLNHSGQVVTILRLEQRFLPWPSVNSFGQITFHFRTKEGDEIAVYSPTGQKLGGFKVRGCPQCGHP